MSKDSKNFVVEVPAGFVGEIYPGVHVNVPNEKKYLLKLDPAVVERAQSAAHGNHNHDVAQMTVYQMEILRDLAAMKRIGSRRVHEYIERKMAEVRGIPSE